MPTQHRGVTPLDRFRSRLESEPHVCEACGYRDAEGGWVAETSGRRVRYRHACPSCGTETDREYRLQ